VERRAQGFRVISLERAHHDAWVPLWTRYLALLGYGSDEAPRGVWSRVTEAGGAVGGLGAWEAELGLVGFLHFARQAHPWTESEVWFVADVFTDERVRGQGVARLLLEAAFERARASGAAWAWGGVGAHNAAARRAWSGLADDIGQSVYRRLL
jgi:GNAT superfamily N-acetyltransferase